MKDLVGLPLFQDLLWSAPGCLNFFRFSLSSVRDALVLSGFRVCVRVGGCGVLGLGHCDVTYLKTATGA